MKANELCGICWAILLFIKFHLVNVCWLMISMSVFSHSINTHPLPFYGNFLPFGDSAKFNALIFRLHIWLN